LDNIRLIDLGAALRHASARRSLSFALLALALIGYCGLPSNPPKALLQVFDEPAPRHTGLDSRSDPCVAPTQAEEYRCRELLVELVSDMDETGAPAILPAQAAFVPRVGEQPTGPQTNLVAVFQTVHRSGDPRAPPPLAV
jgi:hypothetical protein